jgi:peptidoglycan L-alanyl-D-glutamate endopeptidase CwlK
MALAPRSLKALEGVHPDLVKVVKRADELGARFHITDGLRTLERQKQLVAAGKSKTMRSRHLTGHAVDFVVAEPGGGVSYEHADMAACAAVFKRAAAELGVAIEWGGDWRKFVDTPHIELDRKVYKEDGQVITGTSKNTVPPPATVQTAEKPLRQSGTVWGSVVGAFATAGAFFESSAAAVIEWAAKLAEFGPAQSALASMGGNIRSITLGLGIGSAIYVISRRVKAKQEGNAG